jgi:shikimate dehydrogenase
MNCPMSITQRNITSYPQPMPKITGTTKILGVIGNPIGHSLSPVMHNAAIAKLDLDYLYAAFPVTPPNLATALEGFAAIGIVGCNVTIPHKQAVIPLLSEITPLAQAVGAVNTIWKTDKGWKGMNTDVAGFIAPLEVIERDWGNTTTVVLGNGGAARAVVAGCHQLGCGEIRVLGRDEAKLKDFSDSWSNVELSVNGQSTPRSVKLQTHLWDELATLIDRENLLLINSTPIGMYPHEATPVSEELMLKLKSNAIVYDLIYTPRPTKFLQLAQRVEGVRTIDGVEMLVQQGAVALTLWLGQAAPVEVMRQALLDRLGA